MAQGARDAVYMQSMSTITASQYKRQELCYKYKTTFPATETLVWFEQSEVEMTERYYVTDSDLSEQYTLYTRANVGEVFPTPSHL